jgi:hypothetical protein
MKIRTGCLAEAWPHTAHDSAGPKVGRLLFVHSYKRPARVECRPELLPIVTQWLDLVILLSNKSKSKDDSMTLLITHDVEYSTTRSTRRDGHFN